MKAGVIFAGVVGALALLSGAAAIMLHPASGDDPPAAASRPGPVEAAGADSAWTPREWPPVPPASQPPAATRTGAPAPQAGEATIAAAALTHRRIAAETAEPALQSGAAPSGPMIAGGSWGQGFSAYGNQVGDVGLSSSLGAVATLFAAPAPAGVANTTGSAGGATGSNGAPASPSMPAMPGATVAAPQPIGSSGAGVPTTAPAGTGGASAPTGGTGGGTAPGTTPQNPFEPQAKTANGSYLLPVGSCVDSTCPSNGWQFFDPEIAVGYDYALVPTNGNTSLTYGITDIQVSTIVGDGVYQLYLCDAGDRQCDVATGVNLVANGGDTSEDIFDLAAYLETLSPAEDAALGISDPALGASRFAIRGIDPSAGLDPDNPEDFVVGLLFAGTVDGELVITPEVVDPPAPVPEPPGWSILIPALLLAMAARGRRASARA